LSFTWSSGSALSASQVSRHTSEQTKTTKAHHHQKLMNVVWAALQCPNPFILCSCRSQSSMRCGYGRAAMASPRAASLSWLQQTSSTLSHFCPFMLLVWLALELLLIAFVLIDDRLRCRSHCRFLGDTAIRCARDAISRRRRRSSLYACNAPSTCLSCLQGWSVLARHPALLWGAETFCAATGDFAVERWRHYGYLRVVDMVRRPMFSGCPEIVSGCAHREALLPRLSESAN
jgi:hypothetical protein